MFKEPYKLPVGWQWVKLEGITRVFSGSSAPQDEDYFTDGKYPFVRVSDLSSSVDGYITKTRDAINDKAIKELKLIKAAAGTIVFPKSGAAILTNARAILAIDAYIVSHLAALSPDRSKADKDWLYYYLSTVDMGQYSDNPSYPSLKLARIKNILIPLPPLSEQKRIVARINDLFSRIREAKRLRQEAQQEAERLWQSVLADTFPKPGTKLPNGWQWVKLEDIAQVFSGSSAPQDEDYFTEGKYPFVRVSDLSSSVDGYITKTRDAVNDKAIKELKLIKAAAGTIVFPKSGAAILTNARAILAIDAYIVSHLAALSPDRSKADKDWLYYYLSTVDMGQYSDNPSYPSLKLSRIKNIEIPLPNLIKQREIVAYLKCIHEKVQSMKEAQAQTEAELQRLEQAILDKAFLGEL